MGQMSFSCIFLRYTLRQPLWWVYGLGRHWNLFRTLSQATATKNEFDMTGVWTLKWCFSATEFLKFSSKIFKNIGHFTNRQTYEKLAQRGTNSHTLLRHIKAAFLAGTVARFVFQTLPIALSHAQTFGFSIFRSKNWSFFGLKSGLYSFSRRLKDWNSV